MNFERRLLATVLVIYLSGAVWTHQTSGGRPVQVVSVLDNGKLELHVEALKDVLLRKEVEGLPVVVVSVVGKYRQGKSFLLDIFLRYLQYKGGESWLDSSDALIDGFKWKAGPERITSGIHLWSEPFVSQLPSGEQVAVLLMDTQGTDDIGAGITQDMPVFALAALLSSVLIFNARDVGKHDLDSLHLFTEYGVVAAAAGGREIPFQTLKFLVRDWSNPRTYPFGADGGRDFLNRILELNKASGLLDTFQDVSGYLLPVPGPIVAGDSFSGRLGEIDAAFLFELRKFVPQILAPQHLVVKKDSGKVITVTEMLTLVQEYFAFFQSGKSPLPETLFEANQRRSFTAAVDAAKAHVDEEMRVFQSDTHYNSTLEESLDVLSAEMHQVFHEYPKLGAPHSVIYVTCETKLDAFFASVKQNAVSRNEQNKLAQDAFDIAFAKASDDATQEKGSKFPTWSGLLLVLTIAWVAWLKNQNKKENQLKGKKSQEAALDKAMRYLDQEMIHYQGSRYVPLTKQDILNMTTKTHQVFESYPKLGSHHEYYEKYWKKMDTYLNATMKTALLQNEMKRCEHAYAEGRRNEPVLALTNGSDGSRHSGAEVVFGFATTGAALGTPFGPAGIAIGCGVGAVVGLFSNLIDA